MKKFTLQAFSLTAALTASTAFILAAALTVSPAFAGSCPMDMQQIDAAMATSTLDSADMSKVKALRAEGEQLHNAGDHSGSVAALAEAKEMLGI